MPQERPDKNNFKCPYCPNPVFCDECGEHVCDANPYHYQNHREKKLRAAFLKLGIDLDDLRRFFEHN